MTPDQFDNVLYQVKGDSDQDRQIERTKRMQALLMRQCKFIIEAWLSLKHAYPVAAHNNKM